MTFNDFTEWSAIMTYYQALRQADTYKNQTPCKPSQQKHKKGDVNSAA